MESLKLTCQLVRYIRMIFPGHALADSRFHETRERWKYVYRRIDLSVMKLPVNVNLTLSNIASQIRNRMSNIYKGNKLKLCKHIKLNEQLSYKLFCTYYTQYYIHINIVIDQNKSSSAIQEKNSINTFKYQ